MHNNLQTKDLSFYLVPGTKIFPFNSKKKNVQGWNKMSVCCYFAQGGSGVTAPRAVQEMFMCCTEECGLVGNVGDGWMSGFG